jgi:hypothetical protein
MKKCILAALVAIACSGCTLLLVEERPFEAEWRVENATDRTVVVTPPPFGATGDRTLAPGESVSLYSRSEFDREPYFEMVMIIWRAVAGEEIAFTVRSVEGDELKRWLWDDKIDYGEKNFFHESSWSESSDTEKRRKKRCEWRFTITNDDLK